MRNQKKSVCGIARVLALLLLLAAGISVRSSAPGESVFAPGDRTPDLADKSITIPDEAGSDRIAAEKKEYIIQDNERKDMPTVDHGKAYLTNNRIIISGTACKEREMAVAVYRSEKQEVWNRRIQSDENGAWEISIPMGKDPETPDGLKEDGDYTVSIRYADGYGPECLIPVRTDTECVMTDIMPSGDNLARDTGKIRGKTDPGASVTMTVTPFRGSGIISVTEADADGNWEFVFDNLKLRDGGSKARNLRLGDRIELVAADRVGNQSVIVGKKVPGLNGVLIFLLVFGAVLLAFSMMLFLKTQKKLKQMKENSGAC